MTELNGNEKYFYLDDALPTDASRPDGIRAGDLMLYGSECIVLFYESFSTAYSYTPIGRVQNPEGLTEAVQQAYTDNLGDTWNVDVYFLIKKNID